MTAHREFTACMLNFEHCISIRCVGSHAQVNDTWMRLLQFAFHHGIAGSQVVSFGINYEDPATARGTNELRYDACLAITREQFESLQPDLPEGIRLEAVHFGKSHMTVHRGSFASIRDAYADLLQAPYLEQAALVARPPFIEVYRDNPVLARPDELITEIHVLAP